MKRIKMSIFSVFYVFYSIRKIKSVNAPQIWLKRNQERITLFGQNGILAAHASKRVSQIGVGLVID